jgi:hypothetical protein
MTWADTSFIPVSVPGIYPPHMSQKSVLDPGPDWYEVLKSAQYQDQDGQDGQDGMIFFECTQYQGLASMFKSRYQTNSSEHQTPENFPFE